MYILIPQKFHMRTQRFALEEALIRSLAKSWNNLDTREVSPNLHNNMVYVSQWVVNPLLGKKQFLQYLSTKFAHLRAAYNTHEIRINAAMATHPALLNRPCVVLSQSYPGHFIQTCLFINVQDSLIHKIDLCHTPSPKRAVLTGEIPA
jgi:hypothetical protein